MHSIKGEKKSITLKDLKQTAAPSLDMTEIQSTDQVLMAVEQQTVALTPQEREQVNTLKESINFMDSGQLTQYGVGTQRSISQFSEQILSQVKSKDTGYVGDMMSDLMLTVKDLKIDEIGEEKGFLDKIPFLSKAKRGMEKFMAKYQSIETHIDTIEANMDNTRMRLLKDITMFDKLYEKNLEYFKNLQLYIYAGEEKLEEIRTTTLPKLREEALATGEPMDAQLVRDFENTLNGFEKKLHDLKLSKTIAMQTAPQIKLIQNNDRLLVEKIQTMMLNTLPLWKSQIVLAIGLYRQDNAVKMQREVSAMTNDLLKKNSEMLQNNSIEVAKATEEGIVEIETLKQVNRDLINTIEETIKIQKEGKEKRTQAEKEMIVIESDLKNTLLKAKDTNI